MTTETWTDLTSCSTTALLAHLDYLRMARATAEATGRIVEARAYTLRIADAERMLAVHNRRATEVQDQQAEQERAQRENEIREAFLAGVHWGEGFSSASARVHAQGCNEDEAAAEYARSKVGG